MRWSEGHSHCIKKMFLRLMTSPKMTLPEKLEVLYLSPYYLQATFFLVGTFSWLMAETVFRARLPFWTSLWGWSLVLTNFFSLPLVNTVGLFLEESEEKDYLGLLSFIALSYIMVPFQAYASIKGFLEKEEGPWFRTPKTGKITDIFTRGRFYRWVTGIIPGRRPAPAVVSALPVPERMAWLGNPYVALATANSQFNDFQIRPKRIRWVSKAALAVLLAISVTVFSLTRGAPEVLATNPDVNQYLRTDTTATLTNARTLGSLDTGNTVNASIVLPKGSTTQRYQYRPGTIIGANAEASCSTTGPSGYGWILDTPFETGGQIGGGSGWQFTFYESDTAAQAQGTLEVCAFKITVSGGSIDTWTLLFDTGADSVTWPVTDIIDGLINNTTYTTTDYGTFNFSANEYLYVQYSLDLLGSAQPTTTTFTGGDVTGTTDPKILLPSITIPENVVFLLAAAPLIPLVVLWMKKRREAMIYA